MAANPDDEKAAISPAEPPPGAVASAEVTSSVPKLRTCLRAVRSALPRRKVSFTAFPETVRYFVADSDVEEDDEEEEEPEREPPKLLGSLFSEDAIRKQVLYFTSKWAAEGLIQEENWGDWEDC